MQRPCRSDTLLPRLDVLCRDVISIIAFHCGRTGMIFTFRRRDKMPGERLGTRAWEFNATGVLTQLFIAVPLKQISHNDSSTLSPFPSGVPRTAPTAVAPKENWSLKRLRRNPLSRQPDVA